MPSGVLKGSNSDPGGVGLIKAEHMRGAIELISVGDYQAPRFDVWVRQLVFDDRGNCRGVHRFALSKAVDVKSPRTWMLPNDPGTSLIAAMPWYLEDYLQQTTNAGNVRASYIHHALIGWARQTFKALFPDFHAEKFYRKLAGDSRYADGVMELYSKSAAELAWPWEALIDCDGTMIAGAIPIRRHLLTDDDDDDTYSLYTPSEPRPLNVLLVAARTGVHDVPYRLAASALDRVRAVNLTFLRPASMQKLAETLASAKGAFDVVHFDCHGVLGGDGAGGFLVLVDEDGEPDAVSADALAELLINYGPSHVVLNACRSAMVDTRGVNAIASLATTLLSRGAANEVTAMSYKFPVAGASAFLTKFYQCLSSGCSAPLALVWARDALMGADELSQLAGDRHNHPTWMIPVTYRRARLVNATEKPIFPPDEKLAGLQPPESIFVGRDPLIWDLDRSGATIRVHAFIGLVGAGLTTFFRNFAAWRTKTGDLAKFVHVDCEPISRWSDLLLTVATGLGATGTAASEADVLRLLTKRPAWIVLDHADALDVVIESSLLCTLIHASPPEIRWLIGAHSVPDWFWSLDDREAIGVAGLGDGDRQRLARLSARREGEDVTGWFEAADAEQRQAAEALFYYLAGHVATTIWAGRLLAVGVSPTAIHDAILNERRLVIEELGPHTDITRSLDALDVLAEPLLAPAIPLLSFHSEMIDRRLFRCLCEARRGFDTGYADEVLDRLASAGIYFNDIHLHPLAAGTLKKLADGLTCDEDLDVFVRTFAAPLPSGDGKPFSVCTGTMENALAQALALGRHSDAVFIADHLATGFLARRQAAHAGQVLRQLVDGTSQAPAVDQRAALYAAIDLAFDIGDDGVIQEWLQAPVLGRGETGEAANDLEWRVADGRLALLKGCRVEQSQVDKWRREIEDLVIGSAEKSQLVRRWSRVSDLLNALGHAPPATGGEGQSADLQAAVMRALREDRNDDALRLADRAIVTSRRDRDDVALAMATSLRGVVHGQMGDADLARRDFETAITAFERMGDRRRAAVSYHQWAKTAHENRLLEEAGYQYINSAKLFSEVGDTGTVLLIAGNFAVFARDVGGPALPLVEDWLKAGLPGNDIIAPLLVGAGDKREQADDD